MKFRQKGSNNSYLRTKISLRARVFARVFYFKIVSVFGVISLAPLPAHAQDDAEMEPGSFDGRFFRESQSGPEVNNSPTPGLNGVSQSGVSQEQGQVNLRSSGSINSERSFSRDGRFSLGIAFGSQASPFGREAAGFLYGVTEGSWLAIFVQAGLSEESGKAAYGTHLELGVDLVRRNPSALSVVAAAAFGVSEDRELLENKTHVGGSIGLQLEVDLLSALSTALRVEIGGQFAPSEDLRVSTSSSEILVYYHLNP